MRLSDVSESMYYWTIGCYYSVLARLFSGGAAPLGCYIAPLGFHNFYCNPSDDYQILVILSHQEQ